MKSLPRILYIIISFGIGFIFGFFIREYQIFVDMLRLIVGGIAAGLTIQAIQTYKEIKERRLIHSKVLYDNDLKFRPPQNIDFEFNELTLNLRVQPIASTSTFLIGYGKEVDAHLKSGYFEKIWKYAIERDKIINEHNAMAKDFLNNITERIIQQMHRRNDVWIL